MNESRIIPSKDIETVIQEFERLAKRVDEIHFALMGSTLSKDGGMIKRLSMLEQDTEDVKKLVDIISKRNMKNNFYVHVIFAVAGALLYSIYNQFITHILK